MDSNQQTAKSLLAQSCVWSCRRIRDAIGGRLSIRNSREPAVPPNGSTDVIGLCGQGGRHPYFRIPFGVLNATIDRILKSVSTSNINQAIDEIKEACQELRQQTYFDSGTGCINDRIPSIVPLLPPEEIWFDNRELPLDIWRLVSFEFDLVSSAMSSEVSVQDFAFSSVTPNALAFRLLMNQLGERRVNFQIEMKDLPTPWNPRMTRPFSFDVSLARLFFEAGSLLTPLASEDYTKGYAAIRYLHWIDSGSLDLRVKDEFKKDSVDCRYRGLFAEETAIGMMAVVLSDVLRAAPINNTVEVLPPGRLQPNQPIADFIAQASNPSNSQRTTVIAESKGSLGRAVTKSRRERAKVQVANTYALFRGSTEILPLTFLSAIGFSGQRAKTKCTVCDPAVNSDSDYVRLDPVHAWRIAYAKSLNFVGLEIAAKQVYHGEPAEIIHSMDFDRNQDKNRSDRDRQRLHRAQIARERFGMALLLDVGPCALSVAPEIMDLLRHGINEENQGGIREILSSRRRAAHDRFTGASFETALGLGCIFYSEVD